MLEDDRNKYSLELEDAENWLYEDGEFVEKPEYQRKLTELQVKGEAAKRRRLEFDQRPEAINQFGQCLQLAQKVVDAHKEGDEKYNHLDVAEVEKVKKSIQEKDQFWQMASKILNKPKPKVEPPPPPPAESA